MIYKLEEFNKLQWVQFLLVCLVIVPIQFVLLFFTWLGQQCESANTFFSQTIFKFCQKYFEFPLK